MKQIRFIKSTPQGNLDGLIRFMGKLIFIKVKNKNYMDQVINQMKSKGAIIETNNEWIKIDIFGDREVIKLGNIEIDLTEAKNEDIELVLANFYSDQYKKGGFLVEMQDVSFR